MSDDPLVLLKSANAVDRKRGVKLVAQMQNETALKVLMRVYKQDQDESVRELAKKGAQYVGKKLKEHEAEVAAAAAPPVEAAALVEEEKDDYDDYVEVNLEEIEVSEKEEHRAKKQIEAALSLQMAGDKTKAMKALAKALTINPHLRKDNYFISVATSVTGLDSDEAIRALSSDRGRKRLENREREGQQQASAAEHRAKAESFTWSSASLDIGFFSMIIIIGTLLAVMVLPFAAEQRVNSIENQLNPPPVEEDEEPPIPLEPEERAQLIATQGVAEQIAGTVTFVSALILAGILWGSLLISALLFAVSAHFVAMRMLKGNGTLPYMVVNLMGAYNFPLISLYILIIIMWVLYMVGVSFGAMFIGVMGAIGIVSFVIALRTLGSINKTYQFSMGKGLITAMLASIPYNIVMGGGLFVLSLLLAGIAATLQSLAS